MTGADLGPLLAMTQQTSTEYWNDSCAVEELAYAIERGATGATSNPFIVGQVVKADWPRWSARIAELAREHAEWSEVELAWAIVDEVAGRGAALLLPRFEASGGRYGRLSVQVDPLNFRNATAMVDQAVHLHGLAPNMQVKFPATAAGMTAIEDATALGINTNATVSFTLSQAVAAAEAVERGLERRIAAGGEVGDMTPLVVLMIGRLDDWLKALIERDGLAVDPAAPNWAGIAVLKRTYAIFRERGYRSRILAAATRHPLHWTELVGADLAMTLTHSWQVRFNASGIIPEPRIDRPVPAAIMEQLEGIADFRRAYEADGLQPAEFDSYPASVQTLRAFTAAYQDLLEAVREVLLPDPTLTGR